MSLLKASFAVATLSLAGCAAGPPDRGHGDVARLVQARGGPALAAPGTATETRVRELLAEPLTRERAVAVGLLGNPQMRALYAELGLAQAEVLEATRLGNPTVSVSALKADEPEGGTKLAYGIAQNFTELLFLPARQRAAAGSLDGAKLAAGARVQALVAEISAAYYTLVSAEQAADMRDVIARAAAASAEFARRLHAAGNLAPLEWQREEAASTQARLLADAAATEVATARAELNALMGLRAGRRDWQVDARLPLPVSDEESADAFLKLALDSRMDLAGRRREVESLDRVRSLARSLRWFPLLEVGVEVERDADGARAYGPTFAFELPIFNQGQSELARTEALLEGAQADVAVLEGEIGHEVVDAYDRMLGARARVARHRTELIPQREAIVARMQELQNYMLVGQFELIEAKQDEYDAYAGHVEALRDYWLARVDLGRAVGARLPSDARIGEPLPAAKERARPAAPAAQHDSHHEHHDHTSQPRPEQQP